MTVLPIPNQLKVLGGALFALGIGVCPAPGAGTEFRKAVTPFLEKHCLECHGGKHTKADLDFKQYRDDRNIIQEQKFWRNVLQQVNSGEMPPKKAASRPSPPEIDAFNEGLAATIARAEAKLPPDPGHVTIRRLNRKEYNHTVRDLLAVDFNPSENFPADDIGHGFDNIGDVHSISPVHLERYLDAADTIAARAIPLELPPPPTRTTSSNFLSPRYGSEDTRRPVTNSPPELFTQHEIKVAGEYVFRIRAYATNAPDTEPPRMIMLVGDKEVASLAVTNNSTRRGQEEGSYEVKLDLPAGEHRFVARFANPPSGQDERMLFIREFKVIGPADTRTDFVKRVDAVKAGHSPEAHARAVTEWYLTRCFRRPPTREELDRYAGAFKAAQTEANGKWEAGLRELIRLSLCSPKFLFRVELDDRPKTRQAHPIEEFHLASRLSYFLWNTMPDDDLLGLAAKGQLTKNLAAQVRRMLQDERAETLVHNFGLQWLQLERLAGFEPDKTQFPGFDDRLRQSMLKETELFLAEIIREDRSILDLIDADFTFVNRTLARHYGLDESIFGGQGDWRSRRRGGGDSEFVRVSLAGKDRGGLLTQGSVLTVTSNPTRTSPVKRGKWVLEQILGTPPPPAPPGVAELDDQKELKGTLRQRMEQHRADARCASCHQQMDAMGFAFENFDAIGRFRKSDGEGTIDPSGELPDGSRFQGPADLKRILKDKKELVARNLTEKLMTYALGRGLEYYDERAIRKIVADLGAADYKFSALIIGIVQSDPFRLRRGTDLVKQHAGAE